MPLPSMIAELNEATLNAALGDVAALVKVLEGRSTGGEVHLRMIVGRDGGLNPSYTLNGLMGCADKPLSNTLTGNGRRNKN